MEKELNIAEILKDKPSGAKLYSILGRVMYIGIVSGNIEILSSGDRYYFPGIVKDRVSLLPSVLITIFPYTLKNPFFGKRNLGDIRLTDAKSSSGLIYLTYYQRKEAKNNDSRRIRKA